MELDCLLHKVQNVFKHEQRIVGDLYLITADNDIAIKQILLSLDDVVNINKFPGGCEEFKNWNKKLFCILLLNTDSEIYNDLKKNRKYAHLVGLFPKLSQDLFMMIINFLQLHHNLYEAIVRLCSPLSFQVVNICLNSFKWQDLFKLVNFAEQLVIALFQKIVCIDDSDKYDIPIKDLFQRLLLHYDAEKSGCINRMKLWKRSKLQHYAGLVIASLLSALEKCTIIYTNKTNYFENRESAFTIDVSEVSINVDTTGFSGIGPISLRQCYEHIVAKCYENICSVTVDIWLSWVEIDLDYVPDTENTLQRHIGERAYTCIEALKEAESAGFSSKEASDLVLKLKNLALKPHTEEDKANLLTLSEILSNIQDSTKDSKKWMQFLIRKPDFIIEPSALEVAQNHLPLLEKEDLEKLWTFVIFYIKRNSECAVHKLFLLNMVQHLDDESQLSLIKCFIIHFGLSDILKTDDFQSQIVETFNKVIAEDGKEKEMYSQFVILALQSPKDVINRCVAEGITSEVRGHLMAEILARLQAFCDISYTENSTTLMTALSELLINLPNLSDGHQANYPLFVRELVMTKNLNGTDFIRTCLMKNIHQQLVSKNWIVMTACLVTLSELCDWNCTVDCPISLVMILQVIQACRWTPATFSMAAVRVCELTLHLIDEFVNRLLKMKHGGGYLNNLTELARQRISPLNRYHLYRLLTEETTPTDPAMLLIYRMHYGIGEWSVLQITPEDRLKLVHALCFVLPVLTLQEWQELFCVVAPTCSEFQCLFVLVTDALLLCVDSAKLRHSKEVMSCLGFALLNIAQVIKYEGNRWNENDNEYRVNVLKKMSQLVAAFPADQLEGFGLSLVKVLQQLLPEGSRRHPLTPEVANSVTASLALVQREMRQSLARDFLDMMN